jgi:predicted dehydrogenase
MTLSRREFTRLGALGLAARFAPSTRAQSPERRVGFCVIGLGRISQHFTAGVRDSSTSQITGLVSGHRDKAEKIAAQFGVPASSIYSYENMDAIRDNKAIDAVYIALPNNMHAEYTIRSAKAGKHVLCEKPMATSVGDAQAMIDACKSAKVHLMIAYRCHYEPSNLQAIKLIRDGVIGKVQVIESAFGFNINPGEWRLDKKMAGGGPLLDVGIYSLNACRYLTGEEPADFSAYASTIDHDGRFDQVEENLSWITRFPSGIVASCSTTYGASMDGYYRVHGTKGWLELDTAFAYEGLHLKGHYNADSKSGGRGTDIDQPNPERDPMHFKREADHFAQCIRLNLPPSTPGEEGLRDMECMQRIYRSCALSL